MLRRVRDDGDIFLVLRQLLDVEGLVPSTPIRHPARDAAHLCRFVDAG